MRGLSKRKPSPSMVVSCIALFVALGGVSYGVATDSIDSREIKNNSVRSKDVRDNTLTGKDVKEARLGQVPSAATANTATTAGSATTANTATTAGSATPSGPAGGNLTGTYPNPTLSPNTVNSATVGDNTLTGDDILESSLGIVPNSQQLGGLTAGSYLRDAVYKNESLVDAGTALGDGTHSQSRACDIGDTMLSGGPANVSATSVLLESFPTPGTTTAWTARINKGGATDNFSVVVLCVNQP